MQDNRAEDGDIPLSEEHKHANGIDARDTPESVQDGDRSEDIMYKYLHGVPFLLATLSYVLPLPNHILSLGKRLRSP